VLGLNKRWKI